MTTKKFSNALGNIGESYVDEAVTYTAKKKSNAWIKWVSIAACFALIIVCIPTLIHIFNPSEIDDPKSGAQYDFGSYTELCEYLPEGNIIANIPNSESARIDAYVICPEKTTDFSDYNNYSYLSVDVSYDDGMGVNIFCTIKSEMTAKEYVEGKPIEYPSDKTNEVTVENCDVYYTEFEDAGIKGVKAVFSIDDSLYELTTDSFDHEELVQYIESLLK